MNWKEDVLRQLVERDKAAKADNGIFASCESGLCALAEMDCGY